MRKYETKFKRKVVESFLAGEGGAKLLARRWSVPEEKIRTWVSHYRLHGVAGLQPKRSAYTADFKLQVLTHQDRERLSSRQVAAIYDIRNPNQVVVWRRAFDGGGACCLTKECYPSAGCRFASVSFFFNFYCLSGAKRPASSVCLRDGHASAGA